MNYILDTNICIYIIKQKPKIVFDRFKEHKPGDIGISSITLAELQFGVNKSANRDKNQLALNKFLIPLEVLDFDYRASIEYGKVRLELERSGKLIGPLDMLIAAHALNLNLILITNNEKEFKRVSGLKIENWAVE